MTGQTVSPRSRAAEISSTRSRTRFSTTAKTSSTVRPEASIRVRRAALISRMAAGRSSGVSSQCGRAGSVKVGADTAAAPSSQFSLLERLYGCRAFQARPLTRIVAVDHAKPSLELVRAVTDDHVLRALMTHRRLTRAELATATGISKPTAGESVRRLESRGLVVDTGERTPGGRGRGRVGSYYALAADVGVALAVSIAPSGVVAEAVDVYGSVVARAARPV